MTAPKVVKQAQAAEAIEQSSFIKNLSLQLLIGIRFFVSRKVKKIRPMTNKKMFGHWAEKEISDKPITFYRFTIRSTPSSGQRLRSL